MGSEETTVEKPVRRVRRWRLVLLIGILAAVIALVAVSLPDGATYEEYLQLKKGMPRQAVDAIIGEGDYWHHYEGERDVTNWVNKDGTYIQAVFDKNDMLVEVSWKSGWDPKWQKE